MAIVWGGWSTAGNNNIRVGIDLSASGTTITARYYVEMQYSATDNQTLTMSGALTGSTDYLYAQSGGTKLVYTGTKTGVRGSSYSFSAKVTGVYTGGSPSVTVSVTVPAAVPSKPVKPSISSVTATSMRLGLSSAPAANGASITQYQWQVEGGPSATSSGLSHTVTGLVANSSYRCRVRAVNSAGVGAWSDWSASVTTLPVAPSAPAGVSVTRVSDSTHTLNWVTNSSGAAPYASQDVERHVYIGGWQAWQKVATVAANAASWTDTTTKANSVYQWRVVARNASGSAASAPSAVARTTPATPTALSAVNNDGDITVVGTDQAVEPTKAFAWQDNPDGTGWATIAGTTASCQRTFLAVDPTKTHQYRARCEVQSGTSNPSTLVSGWSALSNVVQLQAPPAAPTLLSPTGVWDRSLGIPLAWRHNAVDSTPQKAWELRFRVNGGGWQNASGTGVEQVYVTSPKHVSGLLEWQVRTRGGHPSFGDWSPVGVLTLAARPTATIQSPTPGAGWPSSSADVTWAFYAADGATQVAWEAELFAYDGGGMVQRKTGTGVPGSVLLARMDDDTAYVVQVRVKASSGLWSVAETVVFATEFPLPWPAVAEAVWERADASTCLAFPLDETNPAHAPAVALDVQRQVDGGAWETLIAGLDPHSTWTDRAAPIAGDVCWRAVTYTADGAAQAGTVACIAFRGVRDHRDIPDGAERVRIDEGYLSAGDGFGDVARLYFNFSADPAEYGAASVATHRFAGDEWPTEYSGPGLGQGVDVTVVTPPPGTVSADGVPVASLADLRRIATAPGTRLWRDPDGACFEVSRPAVKAARHAPGWHDVTFSLTRIRPSRRDAEEG